MHKGMVPLAGLSAPEIKSARGLPPVHLWNPPHCGAIPMTIERDGTWTYMGTPIARTAMVRLFSTILRLEPDGSHVLVTPVERVSISVVDAPFIATQMDWCDGPDGRTLIFTTNLGDEVPLDQSRSWVMMTTAADATPVPYLDVRAGLLAKISRPLYYELANWAEDRAGSFGIESGGRFHALGPTP